VPFSPPTTQFPDGTIDCTDFPSNMDGVVSLDWLGFGGYASIQSGDAAGTTCTEGSYCAVACQPGMVETQWPSDQPADGESRGGLLCQNGKLTLTQPSSPYLCEWGTQAVQIQNQLSQGVATCQTQYPGSESMVIPTWVEGGASSWLTMPDENTYFEWEGKLTSAQYYVNNAGISVEDGCLWGTPGSGVGNYSPLNLGGGTSGGVTYLSLIPNPNADGPLNFNVKIEAAPGSTINGECSFIDNQYTGGSNGCTVSTTGVAYFVFF